MKPEESLEKRIQCLEKKTLYLSITLLVVTIIYSYVLTECLYHYLQVRSYLHRIEQVMIKLGPVLDELLNYLN